LADLLPLQSPLAEHELALEVDQVKVIDSPAVIDDADDEKVFILGDGLVTGGLVSDDPPPPPPHDTINASVTRMLNIFFSRFPLKVFLLYLNY
jgi:hypothetical protein